MKIYTGDALSVLKTFPADSIDCCVTSPPYYGLRSYSGGDLEVGQEETPEEYIDALVAIFREVKRVLKPEATLWLNISDSYAGSGKGRWGDGTTKPSGKQATHQGSVSGVLKKNKRPAQAKPKDLIGIPWMLAFALRADGWYLRSEIIWHKPGPMPESVRDRPTRAHEQVFLLSKSQNYFYNTFEARDPITASSSARLGQDVYSQEGSYRANGGAKKNGAMKAVRFGGDKHSENEDLRLALGNEWEGSDSANWRDVWSVAHEGSRVGHFATMPEELARRCLRAGTASGGLVLDPFCGAGTTLLAAMGVGRDAIGIELNPEYVEISRKRIGIFVEVV